MITRLRHILAWPRLLALGWLRLWFGLQDVRQLDVVRIGLGIGLFVSYAAQAGHFSAFASDAGWLPLDTLTSLRENPRTFSVFYHLRDPVQTQLVWALILVTTVLFGLGWRTAWIKWLLWILHVSFSNRAPPVLYGVDSMFSHLLLLCCFAPVGRSLSLDALRHQRVGRAVAHWRAHFDQARASGALRLMQILAVIIYFFSGTEKLRGGDWWDGDALWFAMSDIEFNFTPLDLLANNPWLVNAMTYGSLVLELSYAFLIWGSQTRRPLLCLVTLLHLGIALMMGLWLFSGMMLVINVAFWPRDWVDRLCRVYASATRRVMPRTQPKRNRPSVPIGR